MCRSEVIAHGLFEQADRKMHGCEDWDLWLRLAPNHIFIGTPTCLVRYRLHKSSMTANPSGMQQAVRAVIEKHFGPDDGQLQEWSPEKRRAYGGVYRYYALTSIQRQHDWEKAGKYLHRAFTIDPDLSNDIDLFYDLAYGYQSAGYRDSSNRMNLESNSHNIHLMLASMFSSASTPDLARLRSQTYGTANYALGLVAYKIGRNSLSRRFIIDAIRAQPGLARDPQVLKILPKSFVNKSLLEGLRSRLTSMQNQESR
jgi:tetratricopeptide (TPR) repeat protein